ncbi:hypothetical protein ANTRET_LOCUS6475 [Anthophora retusa]
MKQILAVFILLSVVNAVFTWQEFRNGIRDFLKPPVPWFLKPSEGRQPPSDSFIPPGHRIIPPGHKHFPPGYDMPSTSCQLLDQLINFQVNQQMTLSRSCTVAWICRNPETNDMVITGVDGAQIVIQGHPNNCLDENSGQACVTQKDPNSEIFKTPPSTIGTTIPQPGTTELPRQIGGEGLIDVRIGNN